MPLPPIHPGDIPIKRNTSDLEHTLPGWLRDVRRASGEESSLTEPNPAETPESAEPIGLPSEKPAPPKQKESASPLDFLAGLSEANDDEGDVPDWLKSLQNSMPAPAAEPAPTPEPPTEKSADWLSGLKSETETNEPPVAGEPNWGFGDQPATYNFDENTETASQAPQDTPDWLAALKVQDEAVHPISKDVPNPGQDAGEQASGNDLPDWLASLSGAGTGTASSQPESSPVDQQPVRKDDAPDWLSSLGGIADVQPDQTPAATNAPVADTPDWLSGLGESVAAQPDQIPEANAPVADTPDWLSGLGESVAAQPNQTPGTNNPIADTSDWLSSPGGSADVQPGQIPAANAPAADTPDWLSSLGGGFNVEEALASHETSKQPVADAPDWLSNLTDDSQPEKPQIAPSASEEGTVPAELQFTESDVPAWMTDLQASSFTPDESPAPQGSGIAEVPPTADVPDWISNLHEEHPKSQQADKIEPPPPSVDSELPSWLAEAMGEKPVEKPEEPPAPPRKPFNTGALGELGSLGDAGELPDWMASLGEPSVTSEPAKTPVGAPDQPRDGYSRDLSRA